MSWQPDPEKPNWKIAGATPVVLIDGNRRLVLYVSDPAPWSTPENRAWISASIELTPKVLQQIEKLRKSLT